MEVLNEKEIDQLKFIAENVFESKMFPDKSKSEIFITILAARELSIPPMQALIDGFHLIKKYEGKGTTITMSARMMGIKVRKAGHTITTLHSDDKKCTLLGRRKDTKEESRVTYLMSDATAAGLPSKNKTWNQYPVDMLYKSALSRLCRQFFSDVIGCAYEENEIPGLEPKKDFEPADINYTPKTEEKDIKTEYSSQEKPATEIPEPEEYRIVTDEEHEELLGLAEGDEKSTRFLVERKKTISVKDYENFKLRLLKKKMEG